MKRLPKGVYEIVGKLLSKGVTGRYKSSHEVAQAQGMLIPDEESMKITAFGQTDLGRRREQNEDCFSLTVKMSCLPLPMGLVVNLLVKLPVRSPSTSYCIICMNFMNRSLIRLRHLILSLNCPIKRYVVLRISALNGPGWQPLWSQLGGVIRLW